MLSHHNKAKSKAVRDTSNSKQQTQGIGSIGSFSELFQNPHIFHQASSPNQIHVYEGVQPEKLFGGQQSPQIRWMTREMNQLMQSLNHYQPQPNIMTSSSEFTLSDVEFRVRSFVFMQVISSSSDESWKNDVERFTRESSHFVHNIPLQGSYARSSDGGLTQTLYMASLPFIDRSDAPLLNNRVNLLRDWYLGKNQKQSIFTVKSLEEIIENGDDFLSDLGSQKNLSFISNLFYEIANCIKELHDQCSITHNSILPKNIMCFQQGESFHFLIQPPSFGLASMIDNLNDDHVTYFSPQVFSRFENGEQAFTFDNDVHMLGTLILRILLGEEFDAKQLDVDDWSNESQNLIHSISSRVENYNERTATIFKNLATLALRCVDPDDTKRPSIYQCCKEINENLGNLYQNPPQPVFDDIQVEYGQDKDSELSSSSRASFSADNDDEDEVSIVRSRAIMEEKEEEERPSSGKKKMKESKRAEQPLLLSLKKSSSLSRGLKSDSSSKQLFDSPSTSRSRNAPTRSSDSTATKKDESVSHSAEFSPVSSSTALKEAIPELSSEIVVPPSDAMLDSIIQLSPQRSQQPQQQQTLVPPSPRQSSSAISPPPSAFSSYAVSGSAVPPPKPITSTSTTKEDNNTKPAYGSRRAARDDFGGKQADSTTEEVLNVKREMEKSIMQTQEHLDRLEPLDERCDELSVEAKYFKKKSKSFHFDFSSAISTFFRNIGQFFKSFTYAKNREVQGVSSERGHVSYEPAKLEENPQPIVGDIGKKDQYTIVKRLNDGASAIILQVKKQDCDQLYVMKRFREGVDTDYQREVECLKAFSHNNIVKYVDDFSYSETVDNKQVMTRVVIMEFCNFGDLFKQTMSFAQGGKQRLMRPMRMLRFTLQLFSALEHVHEKKYVHCDVKPQNIFLASDGNLKLGDYGFAVREGSVVCGGTLHYLPPEQQEGQPSSCKMDIYSAACSLFEVLSKKKVSLKSKQGVPLNFADIWDQHLKNNPHFHRKRSNPHAMGLFEVLKSCLEPEATKRPTAKQVVKQVTDIYHNYSATLLQKRFRGYDVRKKRPLRKL
ncbi:hypothetical protein C9374_009231 [Naegleria lovaniensis]|uniref:non-specific serine/threonine protein kinase n=1 Tax=Naegleria lovaniensis TaxID=51637 RepID=A0AA88KEX6_NAELO|nr:uncharacterized protein C9374_009231 [Naegleria lovaniensis]KAG2377320.1 hypothetical protein C9374_009231 [Naegleria lovaniensis]